MAPMLIPTIGLAAGVFTGNYMPGFLYPSILMGCAVGLYMYLLNNHASPVKAYKTNKFHYVWLFLLFAGIGALTLEFNRPTGNTQLGNMEKAIAVKAIVRDIQTTTSGDKAIVNIKAVIDSNLNESPVAPVYALVQTNSLEADIDDVIIFPNSLNIIQDSPSSFKTGYAERMRRKGILYSVYFDDTSKIITSDHKISLQGTALKIRNDIERQLEYSGLNRDTSQFLITLLLGDKDFIDVETQTLFADAGISHVIALSGLHAGILMGIILILLYPLNLTGRYKWKYLIVVPVLWMYAFITGLSPSTVRAVIMSSIFVICLILERRNSSWNALLLSVFIILLANPYELYDIGLQLSFLCVASLIMFADAVNPLDRRNHPWLFYMASLILTTLIATGASWILSAYYFRTFPLMFLPANLLSLPLLPFYISLALLHLLLSICGMRLEILINILDNSYSALCQFLDMISNGHRSVLNIEIPGIALFLWIAGLICLALFLHTKRHKILSRTGISLLLSSVIVIVFITKDKSTGFIVKSDFDSVRMVIKDGHNENLVVFPNGVISEINLGGKSIIVAGCGLKDSLYRRKCDFIVMARGCPHTVEEIIQKFKPKHIILHSSLYPTKARRLMAEADSLKIPFDKIAKHKPFLYISKD